MSTERGKKPNFAIVVSRFNEEVTGGLLKGALKYLNEKDCVPSDANIYYAPGAFEIPLIAQKLAHTGKYCGIICLGCVIKGDTAHFEFISLASTLGLLQAGLNTQTPISFGVLTTYTDEQAQTRSANDAHNKGREAAAACFETMNTLATIR